MPLNTIRIPYREFEENFNPDMKKSDFYELVEEDGRIEIEYSYGPVVNMNTQIIWKIPGTENVYKLRYGHSSPFAMWWCSLTDDTEIDSEFESE